MADVIEKFSDISLKITSTIQQITTKTITIAELKKERVGLELQKTNITDSFDKQIVALDNKIATVDEQIIQAKALGIKEVDADGNIK